MTARLTASLREAPATVPGLLAVALCVIWATDQAGYPVTHWAPGGLILLALLAIALVAVRRPLAAVSTPVRVALGCLAAYTAFSYLTIIWAAAPGEALEGADRTLLYLLVFALLACWPQRGLTAAALLLAWVLSVTGLALFAMLHMRAAPGGELPGLLPGGRLVYPSGYANADAAQWLMAFWPALLLARERRLPWALRGLLAGGAVLLAEIALLSQSRGSLYATPVVLVLVLALLPGRTRTFAVLVPVAAGIAAATPALLHVGDHTRAGEVVPATLHHAIDLALPIALAVALLVAAAAAVESRRGLSPGDARLVHRASAAVAGAVAVVVVAAGLIASGNPVQRVESAWHSFKGGYTTEGGGSRLLSGLGSNRYDFYRVAIDEFTAHPLAGIGADNFAQQYLRQGRSPETPRYPHSVELRVLSQTGLIGTLLAVVGLAAALLAALRAARGPDRLAAACAAAALAGFGYWVIHGSVDWFWEFAGLGAPAFLMLGVACSLDAGRRADAGPAQSASGPRPADAPRGDAPEPRALDIRRVRSTGSVAGRSHGLRRGAVLAVPLAVVLAVVLALALAGPWFSQLEVQSAAHRWPKEPSGAYARLEQAAELDPFSDQAFLVAGSIAIRLNELGRADAQFAKALVRVPEDAYATLERGAIASTQGRSAEARTLLERAAALNPRDPLTQEALRLIRSGRGVSVQALNRLILQKAEELA